MSNYTEGVKLLHSKVSIFCNKSGKIYTGQIFFTQAPLVVLVTNMRYAQKAPFKSKPKSASSLSSTRREGKGGTCRKLEFTGFALSNTAGGKGREAHYYSGSDRVRGTHYTVADCIFWCHICENFSGENSAALKCGNTATLWIW